MYAKLNYMEPFYNNLNWACRYYHIHTIDLQLWVSSETFYKILNGLTCMYNICALC